MRTGRTFVDTNILVYMFDSADPKKRAMAIETVSSLGDRIVVSTQVMQEFFWVSTRKLGMDAMAARRVAHGFSEGEIVIVSPDLVLAAIDLSVLSGITLWHSLIVQAAVAGRCTRILTEDLSHGQTIQGVRIESPFTS